MKNIIATLLLGALAGTALCVEAWLDRRGLDRWSGAFLILIGIGLAGLVAALIVHFGRYS